MKGSGLVLTFLWMAGIASAQNLVPNPGFEELIRCPQSFSKSRSEFVLPGWTSPTTGTPDHFHTCSWDEADVPYNWAGAANPHQGRGYAGIYGFTKERNYREYIQGALAEPLIKGKRYSVSFHYRLSSYSVYATNRVGLHLLNEPVHANHDEVLPLGPVLSVVKDSAVTDQSGGWERATMEYVALGGEQFVVIGNFSNNDQTPHVRLPHRFGKSPMLHGSSYYYVDDVSVICLDTLVPPQPDLQHIPSDTIVTDFDYRLNIQFEFDSHVLLRSSFPELDRIVHYLKSDPTVNARLLGHTDFIGSDEYNNRLSQERARSVANYFVEKGIRPERLLSYGFGKTRPIRLERTDEARQINRRVEVRFTRQQPQ